MRKTDERILEAALALFAEKGFRATTKEIAKKAMVSEATIFRNFGSKEGLMQNILMKPEPDSTKAFRETSGDVKHDLQHIGNSLLRDLQKQQRLFQAVLTDPTAFEHMKPHVVNRPLAFIDFLASYLEEMAQAGKVKAGNHQAQAQIFISLIFGYFTHRIQLGEQFTLLNDECMIEESIKIFLDGIR